MRKSFRIFAGTAMAAGLLLTAPAAGLASEVRIVREFDSNNYDPQKSTARAAAEVLYMLGDTLLALEPDMKTLSDGLAESWEVSDDGLVYTFRLKEGVRFCDGKMLTADDVVYSFKRLIDPETASPAAWRAGEVEDIVALDDRTVEYRLKVPFSELFYQLTQSYMTIIDQDNVEALGADFGIAGLNATGPFCWENWTPRDRMILKRHEAYEWGPSFYANQGPSHIERIVWQIVPEENTRTVALITDQAQVSQYVAPIALEQLRSTPNIEVHMADEAYWTYYIGFKMDKPTVSEEAVRKAINLAVNREAIAEDLFFGEVQPAYRYISQATLDWNPEVDDVLLHYDVEQAKQMLDEAGWVPGSDGIRVKDGQRLAPIAYMFAGPTWHKMAEAVQADLLEVGIDMQIQSFDATVAWSKFATQEFDMFGMSYPHMSASDAVNYFRSKSIPSPNRMNWNDPETDELLRKGQSALSDEERAEAYGQILLNVHEAAAWLPLTHEPTFVVQSTVLEPVVPHSIFGVSLYKGLDLKFRD